MKQNFFSRILLIAVLLGFTGVATAQIHPLSFGVGYNTTPNWYANYVGMRFDVTAPAVIAGPKIYNAAYSGSSPWGGQVVSPIVDVPVIMGTGSDTTGCTVFPAGYMNGKIALEWRNHLSPTACEFGQRALNAQTAGAIAVVIINDEPGQGPVGMGAASVGGSVTIPVFMIGNLDGIAMVQQYNSLPANSVTMTITPWGGSSANDLGFVPNGIARWHNYAIPANQLTASSSSQVPYLMDNGAFIANYGVNPATNIKLSATTSFTPTGGSATVQNSDTVVFPGPFYDDGLPAHNTADSIMALFNPKEYALSASGTGRFDVTYAITSDSTDGYPSDNTQTVSFYTTDSLYSKGQYDFVHNKPNFGEYLEFGGGVEFLWGPMYYVANAGTAISAVQFSLALNTTTAAAPLTTDPFVYIFKWTDGANGMPVDSIVENGEFQLMGSAQYLVNGTSDTSEALLYQQIFTDTNGNNTGGQVALEANSWYYVCVDVPASNYLGCDGSLSPYPRVYGRYHADGGYLDYSNILNTTTKDSLTVSTGYGAYGNAPVQSAQVRFLTSVDSFVYSSMTGLIPAVALIANNHPVNAVHNVAKPLADVSLFPNPAKDQLTVTASFDKIEKTVSYEIIDGLARFVSRVNHNDVQSDTYTINTSNLASGNYYLIISAEGRVMSRKFAIVK